MTEPEGAEAEVHRLRGAAPIELGAGAFHHPRSVRLGGHCTTPYADVTQLYAGARVLRIGTRHGSFLFRRQHFSDPQHGPEAVADAIAARIARRPGGEAQRARMAELDRRSLASGRLWVGPILVAASVVAFVLQAVVPDFYHTGFFSRTLVAFGESWRFVTANLLHASLLHLLLNAIGLLAFGGLLERSLGVTTSVLVAAGGALGSSAVSYLVGYEALVGASGIVYGFLGALLWIEFDAPDRIPVLWRLPRRLFVGLLVLETVLMSGVPAIAHGAHLGGFVGGGLVSALLAGSVLRGEPEGWARRLAAAGTISLVMYCVGLQFEAVRETEPARIARRGQALMALELVPPQILNNEAWRIAISASPAPGDLQVAGLLAERAVRETAGRDPTILDTLAEVYFQAGRVEEALSAIDEAIALAPEEDYYREQRRRFTGERPAEDRPQNPTPWPLPPTDEGPAIPRSDSAIRV